MKVLANVLPEPAITTPRRVSIDATLLLGRILAIPALVHSGVTKVTQFNDVAKAMGGDPALLASLFGEQTPLFHFPAPALFLILAILFDLGGTALIVLGLRTRLVAMLLFLYSLLAVAIYHWEIRSTQDAFLLLVNAPFFGALLILAAVGGGHWSLDGKFGERSRR